MGKKLKMLVVNAMDAHRDMLKQTFAEQFIILEAQNGVEAMELLEHTPGVAIVLLELCRTVPDGLDILRCIKESHLDIPVLVITTDFKKSAYELKALELGAEDFIDNPYNQPILQCRVRNVLRRIELERQRAEAVLADKLTYAANHDPLTGVYNQRRFYEAVEEMLQANPKEDYVLIRWNVERFKLINDLFGSQMGDKILRGIAQQGQALTSVGIFGRLEADHFASCFPKRFLNIEEIAGQLRQRFALLNDQYDVTINFGVYEIDDKNLPVSQMCDRAKLALQTIKGNYLKKYAVYDDYLRQILMEEQEIASEMNGALRKGQFVIYLQPVYSLSKRELVSAEALVRWEHPQKGLIGPNFFIPLFEKNGFITELDYYVWEQVCRYQRERLQQHKSLFPISVNVSRRSLYDPKLYEKIIELIDKYGIEPRYIRFEITESAYADNPEQLLRTMEALQNHGFTVMMDDFGSGYSSLNMLKDINVDILKIDMKFMENFETSNRAGNILTSVVRMAKWLKLMVIAEGVETKLQEDFLRSIGCDIIQGYYFSKPLPIGEFENLIGTEKTMGAVPLQLEADVGDFDSLFNGRQLISRVFNSIVGGVGIYELEDDRLEVLRVNDSYYDIMAYDPQSFYNEATNVFDQVHPEDREVLLEACRRAVRDKGADKVQLRRRRHDGKMLWLDVGIRYLSESGGNQTLICLAINDITEQKEQEIEIWRKNKELLRHYQFLQALYQAVPCGIVQFAWGEIPKAIDFNDACWRIFRYPDRESCSALMQLPAHTVIVNEDKERFNQALRRAVQTGAYEVFETRIRRYDNTIGWVRNIVESMQEPEGKIILQNVFWDITKEK